MASDSKDGRRLYQQVSNSEDTLDGCSRSSGVEKSSIEDEPIEDIPKVNSRRQRRFRFLRYAMLVVVIALVGALAYTIGACTSVRKHDHNGSASSRPPTTGSLDLKTTGTGGGSMQDCGDSVEEARANGCIYDVMLQLWVPATCYDGDFSEEYLAKYKWKWYYDIDAELEMPDEVMRRGEHEVAFMVDDYHRRHCTYTWEITTRALQAGKPLLEEFLSFKHVKHCDMMLFMPPWNSTKHPMGVEAHSGFARCAPYDLWRLEMPA